MYSVEVSIDDYEDEFDPVSRPIARWDMVQHEEYSELFEIPGHPVTVKIDDTLTVELTCERVGDGSLNFSLTHNDHFLLAGKYHGEFTVRMFAESGATYVVDVKRQKKP